MSDGTNPQDPTADAVVPPPPAAPIPDGLIPSAPAIPAAPEAETPPPPHIPPADAVIPPPPPEAQLRSTRRTPLPPADELPSAVADDWAQPSVAPEVPSSGGYRVLTGAIFAFLVLLLVGAVAFAFFLATTTSFPWSAADAVAVTSAAGLVGS